ncbi:MAG: hypothetical protein HYR60_07995 [Acidobacteria bacterium]|nr:hypothetical protein [Acidobacteriota bacterium]
MVAVEAIKFNHDSNSAAKDALNIRKNAAQFISVPEWRRFLSVNPEDSRAAYAVAPTQGKTIAIQVSLSANDAGLGFVEVRVEHHVKARPVNFTNGQSGFVVFELIDPPIAHGRVGIWDVEWHWEYRLGPYHPWHHFSTTRHRFYVVLDTPTAPWKQAPYNMGNTQMPWTDVLDYACRWAAGATSTEMAAALVTQSVYALGPGVVTYDCPGGGSSHYSWGNFDCTAFLDRLHGGVGNGVYINCSDCATIVSTFANSLGCDLWQSRMGWGFALNELLAIGSNVWQTACGWGGFSYHEVAWEAACTANDDVFDACLRVDGDSDPTAAPRVALLPQDLRFGNPGDLVYRDRLATPAGRPNCNPQPGTRQRRLVV